MSAELEHIWSQVLSQLGQAVDESTYRIWLEPLRPVELTDGRLVIEAPERTIAWVSDRFGRLLARSVGDALGPQITMDLVSAPAATDIRARASGRESPGAPSRGSRASAPPTLTLTAVREPTLNPKLSFEQFVIGDSNRLAHAAALAVAEMPSQAYNPLFLYGPPGLGKTHLLHSIATFITHHSSGLSVRYSTGEAFTNEFLAALRDGAVERFKDRFRRVDVLLIDDVQFLERKTRTEEEFFHTFNALSDLGSQIVVTSDRLPRDLGALEDRLRERFEAGLVADIRPPDLATRLAVLRKRVHHDRVPIAEPQALEILAERITVNIRALEGALIRVVAYASLTGRPLTAKLTREVLHGLYPVIAPPVRSVTDIQHAVCRHFQLSAQELNSSSRAARVSWPRQVAMYVARELTEESLPAIGRHFGGRDHTTVMHACKRTAERMTSDPDARETVGGLLSELRGEPS